MDTDEGERAVEGLQDLGLKTYEARCLAGLTRTGPATARELSEATDVPRTRVYDAVSVLAEEGLVEVQHANPRRFRAVPVAEVVETLRNRFEPRIEELGSALRTLEEIDQDGLVEQRVWALSGATAVESRVTRLAEAAKRELVVVVGDAPHGADHVAALAAATADGTTVRVGSTPAGDGDQVLDAVPGAERLDVDFDWLASRHDASVGRFVLADRETLVASVVDPADETERAVVGEGDGNAFVVVARRLLAAQVD